MRKSPSRYQGYADLHTHSLHSDGRDVPADVVVKAKQAGLEGLSLTDHDTYAGVQEAAAKASETGLRFLGGVELSTVWNGKEVHILGYFPFGPDAAFLDMIRTMAERRIGRMKRMISKLNRLGCALSEEEVFSLSGGEIIGRAHLFRAIRDKYRGEYDARADEWLNIGGAAFEPTSDMTPEEAIRWIDASKGVPVLAHPGTSKVDSIISDLIGYGLKGIEAVYPKHSSSQTSRYKRAAREAGLIVTGGSDWHGLFQGSDIFHSGSVGASKVPVETMDDIEKAVQ